MLIAPTKAASGTPISCSEPVTRPPPYPLPPASTITATAARAAPSVTPRMSGLASGLRANVWVRAPARPSAAPTATATTRLGQAQLHDDEPLAGVAAAEQRAHHVGHGDREVADREVHRDQGDEDDQADDADESGPQRHQPRHRADPQRRTSRCAGDPLGLALRSRTVIGPRS